MKDGWYYLVYQKGRTWIDGVKKRTTSEEIQEAILQEIGELADTEGCLEIKDGKYAYHEEKRLTVTSGIANTERPI